MAKFFLTFHENGEKGFFWAFYFNLFKINTKSSRHFNFRLLAYKDQASLSLKFILKNLNEAFLIFGLKESKKSPITTYKIQS